MPSRRNGEEWPLTEAEYNARQLASQRVTVRPRPCDCIGCTLGLNYALLSEDGPRPGETQAEWLEMRRQAERSVSRRMSMNINIRG